MMQLLLQERVMPIFDEINSSELTLVNVYVALPVFTRIAGTTYVYFLE